MVVTTLSSFDPAGDPPDAAYNAPIEILTLPSQDLRHDDILRSFDLLRRRLVGRLRGSEGHFGGYDMLELSTGSFEALDRVALIAIVTSTTVESVEIRFEAWLEPGDTPEHAPSDRAERIALGEGSVVAFG